MIKYSFTCNSNQWPPRFKKVDMLLKKIMKFKDDLHFNNNIDYDCNLILTNDKLIKKINNGIIEIAPIAFMRGRTLENCFVILDEAQNTTKIQMKMFLTRLGKNSQMVVVGDITQIDLVSKNDSGLLDAKAKLSHIKDIGFVFLNDKDVVRHDLVKKIINAYDNKK